MEEGTTPYSVCYMGSEKKIIRRRSAAKGALIGISVIRLVKDATELLKFCY